MNVPKRNTLLATALILLSSRGYTQTAKGPGSKSPGFEVESVKPSPPGSCCLVSFSPWGARRFTATNATLELLIELAYGVDDKQIEGAPNWLSTERYDVIAQPEGAGLAYKEMQPLLQELLARRFKLAAHRESKLARGYALVVAKGGPKLKESAGDGPRYILPEGLRVKKTSMPMLASMLSRPLHSPVDDETGLTGEYDIDLDYSLEGGEPNSDTALLPSIFTAVKEQLGLQLKQKQVAVEILAIDHAERLPTAN